MEDAIVKKEYVICDNEIWSEWYLYIRPIQKKETKPLTADELYRICGNNGYEVRTNGEKIGVITCIIDDELHISGFGLEVQDITHFRKAYSQNEWKPISEIEREEQCEK